MPGARPREAIESTDHAALRPRPTTKLRLAGTCGAVSDGTVTPPTRGRRSMRETPPPRGRTVSTRAAALRAYKRDHAPRPQPAPQVLLRLSLAPVQGEEAQGFPSMTLLLPPWSTRRSGRASGRRGQSLAWLARRRSFGRSLERKKRLERLFFVRTRIETVDAGHVRLAVLGWP